MAYDHQSLEQKWQKFWEENQIFKTENPKKTDTQTDTQKNQITDSDTERNSNAGLSSVGISSRAKPKKYILDMFPYPSGAGLHVGHPKGYTATDIISRYYHAKGYNVLHPMGWDAFGLPAENYAIKTGTHPRVTTAENIATFTEQMKNLGFSYDWDRSVDTTDPGYYQWTQWIFLELFRRGLAYEQDLPINYCPSCKTGLANEEVLADTTCDRCGTRVEKRRIRQWVLAITKYAERLLSDIDDLDWPEGIKEMQRNWIGKSEGCEFRLLKDMKKSPTSGEKKGGRVSLSINGGGHDGLAKPSLLKNEDRLSKGVGLNCPARSSLGESIFQDMVKVKKKEEILRGIDVTILNDNKNIILNAQHIFKHFSTKGTKEFYKRKQLLSTIYHALPMVQFYDGVGYFILKDFIVQIILGEQSNGNYFVKTYYVADRLTQEYREYMRQKEKPTALILHGWDDAENCTIWHWMSHLKTELEKVGYDVIMEQLPGNNAPDLERQLAFLEQYKNRLDERSVIVGHSMGGFLGMHFVERLDKKIGKLICVAPIFNGLIDHVDWSREITGWEIGSASMKQNYNPEKIRKNVADWHIFLSGNDQWIIPSEAKKHFESIGVKYTMIHNAGHFVTTDGYARLDTLLEYIVPHIRVYTTRVDTVYGMTYAVLAPDHPKVAEFITVEQRETCQQYIEGVRGKSDQDRTNDGKEKTGVFTGSYVVNPYNGESVPLWIGDFVLGSYGTGALMAVPAHDERDFEFAMKYNLNVKQVIDIGALGSYTGSYFDTDENLKEIFPINPTVNDRNNLYCFSHKELGFQRLNGYRLGGPLEKIVEFVRSNNLLNKWNFYLHTEANGNIVVPNLRNQNNSPFSPIQAKEYFIEKAETEGFGQKKVNYKLRDWLFSRQRYWGEPIPLIHISHENYAKLPVCNDGNSNVMSACEIGDAFINKQGGVESLGVVRGKSNDGYEYEILSEIYDGLNTKIIIDSHLPLTLPEVERYEPAGDGQSPLANVADWVNVKLAENLSGKRETNTMPQWGGSCWYYLRYMDNKNQDALASKEAMEYWQNVDEYVGGAEHAVLHLLYARFWHKVLYDIGVVPTIEPFQKLTNVGMILAYAYERADGGLVAVDLVEERDGKYFEKSTNLEVKQVIAKMSKSLKNVINPNDIVREYGADTLRLYEMSMSAFTDTAPWNPDAIVGVRRFLDRVYSAYAETSTRANEKYKNNSDVSVSSVRVSSYRSKDDMKAMKLLHKTVKKVGEDIVDYKFNTAISALMILLNEGIPTDEEFASEWREKFLILLHPFAPHMAEELWFLCHPELVSGSQKKGEDAETSSAGQSIYHASWPEYDEWMLVDDEVTIAIQVNGKLRGTLTCFNGVAQEEVSALAHADPNIEKWIKGKLLVKEIFIPNKMLSIVVKDEIEIRDEIG